LTQGLTVSPLIEAFSATRPAVSMADGAEVFVQLVIDAITTAQQRIQERYRQREDRGDRRQKMLIEFILSGKASIVAISEPELDEKSGHIRVTSRRSIAILELSRTYVRGNIYEIAWDALRLDRKESRKLLEPMLPPESPSSREP